MVFVLPEARSGWIPWAEMMQFPGPMKFEDIWCGDVLGYKGDAGLNHDYLDFRITPISFF
jgi:hypothetical protein